MFRRIHCEFISSVCNYYGLPFKVQLNLPTTATLGTEENSYHREVAVVESLKQESMCRLLAKKMAAVERWPLEEFPLYTVTKSICHYTEFYTTRQNYQKLPVCIPIIQLYSVIQK